MEAGAGIEPANSGFADRCLTTWLPRRFTLIRKSFPKIRIVKIKGENFYQLNAGKQGTNGKREHFLDRAKAESQAGGIEARFQANGTEGLALSAKLRAMAIGIGIRKHPKLLTMALNGVISLGHPLGNGLP